MAKKKTKTQKKYKEVYQPVGDPIAKSMWGKKQHVVFKDKTKYNRKKKHKNKDI